MPAGKALWIEAVTQQPMVLRDAPEYIPQAGEVLVKNAAMALNPVDFIVMDSDPWKFNYPHTNGCDVSGEVVATGEGVTNVKPGQRVLGYAVGLISENPGEGGLQEYTIIHSKLVSPIPDTLPATAAAVLPLALATAAHGLYGNEHLALPFPQPDAAALKASKNATKTILVWGGASSVGSCGIQLARASGFAVYATASQHNHAYLTDELGASRAFDARSATVVDDIVTALKEEGKELEGVLDAISEHGTPEQCASVIVECGTAKTHMATVLPWAPTSLEDGKVTAKPVFAPTVRDSGVGEKVFVDFVGDALMNGVLVAKPDAKIVGKGLESVTPGLELLRKGLSRSKLVVEL